MNEQHKERDQQMNNRQHLKPNQIATALFTSHGIKRKLGYPVRINGRNALAYVNCETQTIEGYVFQEEINEALNQSENPNPVLKLT